jgi:hypothetical protein
MRALRGWRALRAGLLAMFALSGAGAAQAMVNPGYYVVTVYDDEGLRTLDFRYWSVQANEGNTTVLWPEVGVGWNVNGRWYTELLASWITSSKFATRLETLNWQNDVLLTQGQYPFDLAVHTQVIRPQHPASGWALEVGPVFQTDIDRTQLVFNVFFQRGFESLSGPTELSYQWQVRHRWNRWLHFGAQGFGELGTWNDWLPKDQQSHRAGPALFGAVPAGPGKLQWQAAYLFGKTYARRGEMFTARMKYDF